MLEKYCSQCEESRIIIPLDVSGACPYCGGSPRDCECGELCQECDGVLVLQGEWGQA